ncbi:MULTISPECIES: urease accessory protein UreD [Rhodococcus]|uniref:urease accessory protein UreD n=1 Tax=Rhodococcus TaxID=1827 RepID=UPI001E3DBFA7|nr:MULTISPECIES: urease accessory protein UreD [Rhodococcus]BDB60607.1 hypothetical protein RDE2_24010 [Rhodococcus sp. RDE2]
MSRTTIRIDRAPDRARLALRAGMLVPRTVEVGPDHARVALVAAGALLLGGDSVTVDVHVDAGCTLELQDIGGTVAYDADNRLSRWDVRITVAEGGTLVWDTYPFVIATGARVHRDTRIELASDAAASTRETLVLGRHGETGGAIRSRTSVTLDRRPLFVEELYAHGAFPEPGILGSARVHDVIATYGRRAEGDGVVQLEGPGSLLRFLGADTHSSPLESTWRSWRSAHVHPSTLEGSLTHARP